METANLTSRQGFLLENISRVQEEKKNLEAQKVALAAGMSQGKEEIQQKEQEIEKIRQAVTEAQAEALQDEEKMKKALEEKEKMSQNHKAFFAKRDELSERINLLDKESYRLTGQKEKLEKRLLKAKKEKAAEEERKSCFENYKESVDRILNFHGAEDALFRELIDKIVVYQGQMVCVWIKYVPFGIKMRIHSSGKRDNYNT